MIKKTTSQSRIAAAQELTLDRLESVSSWGKASTSVGWVFRPTAPVEISDLFDLARRADLSICFRGGGNSYGDAAYNEGGIVLDLTRMRRILDWNPQSGIITVEPGVTLRQLWEYVLEDGWWPPVCTGTMNVTMGGAAAMNVHGKNAYKVGTLGQHILDFEFLLPNGETILCSRDENADIFHAAIGGFGMLGCFTRLTIQMKAVETGLLDVRIKNCRNLSEMFKLFRDSVPNTDYLVGWIDMMATGRSLGRGEIHLANYLPAAAVTYPTQSLRVDQQNLSDSLYGILPRSSMWRLMRPFFNTWGVPWINTVKYWASRLQDGKQYQQPHAQFHFLLNYFPGWEKATGRGGLIQYQPFVPDAQAEQLFSSIITRSRKAGQLPYLGVLKRHKADPFLMTHGLDGWSIAIDYQVNDQNRTGLIHLLTEFDQLVADAGGRFYPAKDSVLRPQIAEQYLGTDTIAQFRALKQRCDPQHLLQTNFWRRVFDEHAR